MHRSSNDGGGQGPRSRAVRWITGIVITLLVLALVAVGAIGWYFSGVALAVGSHQPGYGVTVRGVAANGTSVELSSTVDSLRPEPAGLEWTGGYGRIGAIIARSPATVTRVFTPLVGRPSPGLPAGVDVYDYPGDPRSSLGLAFTDLRLPSGLGTLPAWYVAGEHASGSWVVFVHGHDGSRRESLRYLPLLHARGIPVLVPTYRNDVGAPPSPDGKDHLGDTEWRDVEPAVRYALGHGARDVVLFGWSMGGAVSLQFADRSPLRDHVRGLVLDSPVIDWRDVLTHQAQLRGLPGPVTAVAEWLVGVRLGTSLDRFDWVSRAKELRRPILLVHSGADAYVLDGPSRALARARPDLVTFLDIPGAGHTRGWNVDPQRYDAGLTAWLSQQGM
jgi:pimeloyl-ACP methyl ester carboxylesterase